MQINVKSEQVQIGVLSVKNFKARADQDEFNLLVHQTIAKINQDYGMLSRKQLKKKSPIDEYAEYYKRYGYSYPVLGQLESFLKGEKQLEEDIPLLKILLLTELESMLLMAGHDMNAIQMPLTLDRGPQDTEIEYVGISKRNQKIGINDFYIRDTEAVISSVLRGPDYRTRITESTQDALFIIYGLYETNPLEEELQRTLDRLEKLLKACSPECIIGAKNIVQKNSL
ncbi:hypothetical protein [Fusibacter ferrireducens]|uniref:B3/B4 tRNA-binding domain-containing protein n=1 Tax=Fusibacter ferrireducens TaxID=2785058 RepID=A0ABR9ZSY9_9FIRM|nr:hypothetical protein [Fusibacter ferrireducens]MBF4693076.1 hypothetical protein [Fusibacter ferrireducens]